jgi:hypothetical protein
MASGFFLSIAFGHFKFVEYTHTNFAPFLFNHNINVHGFSLSGDRHARMHPTMASIITVAIHDLPKDDIRVVVEARDDGCRANLTSDELVDLSAGDISYVVELDQAAAIVIMAGSD